MDKVPVFVIMHDLMAWPKAMLAEIDRMGGEPILLDNASTYPPLLDWYATKPCEVIRLDENIGHHSPWLSGAVDRIVPKNGYYVVTDPDLDLSGCPNETIQHLANLYDRYHDIAKAGLSIEILNLPEDSPVYHKAIGWETKFWQKVRDWQCYDAPIDTTFAVYSRKRNVPPHSSQFMKAVRANRPFTCLHLPFYLTTKTFSIEDWYYLKFATHIPATMPRHLQCLVSHFESRNTKLCKSFSNQ